MAMNTRILRATISMPSGDVILNQTLKLRIRVKKAALAIQNRATIDVTGMSTQLRETLLSQFTAWNKRQVDTAQSAENWINVKIEAGYVVNGREQSSVVFLGQVTLCELIEGPPNITVRLTCYSRQVDKTQFVSDPAPAQTTFYGYVEWAAKQMGFGTSFICQTSVNDVLISNPARSIITRAALLLDIQNYYRPNVAAFVDDNVLIVKDRSGIINPDQIAYLYRFVGIPTWTEWGVEFVTMYDPSIRLAQAVDLSSVMNPSVNGKYVIMELEYDLSSRDRPFYVKGGGSPPA